jgi:hypothetical protein
VEGEDVDRPGGCQKLNVPGRDAVQAERLERLGRCDGPGRALGQGHPGEPREVADRTDRNPRQDRHPAIAGEQPVSMGIARAPAPPVSVEVDTGRTPGVGRCGETVEVGRI